MKVRKLIVSISMLVLAATFLINGVYDASIASLSISSSVNYEVSDVFVDISYWKDSGEHTTVRSYNTQSGIPTSPKASVDNVTLPAGSFAELGDTVVYSVEVKNISTSSDVTLTLAATYTPTKVGDTAISSSVTGDCTSVTLGHTNLDNTRTIVVTLTLTNDLYPSTGTLVINVTALDV